MITLKEKNVKRMSYNGFSLYLGEYCDKKQVFTSHRLTVITMKKSYVCNTLYAIFVTFEQNVIGKNFG